MLGRLWAALGLTGVYSGCVMIGEPPLLVSGLASNYFRIRALLSTPDFGLRADSTALARARLERSGTHKSHIRVLFLFMSTVLTE